MYGLLCYIIVPRYNATPLYIVLKNLRWQEIPTVVNCVHEYVFNWHSFPENRNIVLAQAIFASTTSSSNGIIANTVFPKSAHFLFFQSPLVTNEGQWKPMRDECVCYDKHISNNWANRNSNISRQCPKWYPEGTQRLPIYQNISYKLYVSFPSGT